MSMRSISFAIICAVALMQQASRPDAGVRPKELEWRRVVILQSTRADVERLLGPSEMPGYLVVYSLPEGSVSIEFATQSGCEPHREGFWNVPEWTVEEVTYTPFKAPPRFKSLNLDMTRFRKEPGGSHTPDIVGYVDDEEGVSYTVDPDGSVHNIVYFP